jgi:DNA-binding transcriptional regulator GbsR (MarR family)
VVDDDIRAAEIRVAEVIGGLMEFWGFRAIMGRLWTILYLSLEPLTAAELGDRLQVSAGGVSMALNDLQKWGVVRKSWRPGDRRDFYEPETSIWKMVTRVFRERELSHVKAAIESFNDVRQRLGKLKSGSDAETKKRLRFIDARVLALLTLARIGEGLLSMLSSGQPVDPQPMKSLFHPEDEE